MLHNCWRGCQGRSWCMREMVKGTSNGWDDPYQTNTMLDLNFSDQEQSSDPKNLITSQDGSWEVFLKSQWGYG